MSNEENTGHEHDSAHRPAADQSATQENRNETPHVRESKLESEHADLPPMSVIGASAEPAAKPGTIAAPKQFGRRGTPRGAPASPGTTGTRPAIGVVENPAEAQESISGPLASRTSAPQGERRERREPREHREHREPREPREPRERREPRHEGERQARREDRPRREDKPRIQIEPVVIPVQEPIGFWASFKRKLATLFGIPDKAVFVPSGRSHEPREGRRDDRGGRHGGRGRDRGRGRGRDGRRGDRGHRGPREG